MKICRAEIMIKFLQQYGIEVSSYCFSSWYQIVNIYWYCIYFFKQIIMSCHIYLILYSNILYPCSSSSRIIIFSCQNITKITFVRTWFNEAPRLSISTPHCTGPLYCRSLYLVYRCRYICASPWWPSMGNGVNEQSRRSFCWMKARSSVYYTLLYTYIYIRISLSIEKACTSSFGIITNRFNS